MVKEHNVKQGFKKEAQGKYFNFKSLINITYLITLLEAKRKEACAAAGDLTQALVDHLNVGYVNTLLSLTY